MAFEEEFDIEIPDDAAEHIQTVGDAVKFIDEKLAGQAPAGLSDGYERAAVARECCGGFFACAIRRLRWPRR